MAKKKEAAEKGADQKSGLRPVLLLAGPWQAWLKEDVCKLLVARALNDCVREQGLRIRGYWITRHQVCLVLWLCPAEQGPMLDFFYKRLQDGIISYRHHEELKDEIPLIPLFEQQRLFSEDLIRLLTGKHIDLPYYDPQLARLKDELRRADYCSLIDHSGAVGPVIIDPEKSEDIKT